MCLGKPAHVLGLALAERRTLQDLRVMDNTENNVAAVRSSACACSPCRSALGTKHLPTRTYLVQDSNELLLGVLVALLHLLAEAVDKLGQSFLPRYVVRELGW